MITIGQLAGYAGVSVKAVRVYHDKGLLPEPDRDQSGYRRYGASHVIELIKIRTLAEAGVPLARIRDRLRALAAGELRVLPEQVSEHLERLPALGFSQRWVDLEADLWILVFATHPDTAMALFRDQAQALGDPDLLRIYLDYDRAHDLDPADPRLDDLARRIVTATTNRYGPGVPPGQEGGSAIPALIQSAVNASSPAWRRLDQLIRAELGL